ncbi:hypothetical protein H5410_055188 [Solanum commersonii]|uniref:5'-nucleotidase n=1 Tax=Solanum commersonii TaxID=4109 RepID=A0A9J5WJL4_SOLCO|nr:hypothetical protein H5410_055188 [Solanum commersonii]
MAGRDKKQPQTLVKLMGHCMVNEIYECPLQNSFIGYLVCEDEVALTFSCFLAVIGKLVIADFDGTLTKYWIDGCRGQGSHNVLQQEDPEFNDKRQKLYEYYQPLEFDPTIPLDEKTKLMEEWWEKTHALLIEGGVTYSGIQNSVAKATIAFRDGVTELLELLEVQLATISCCFLRHLGMMLMKANATNMNHCDFLV